MASCQINITGTSGSVLIRYTLASTKNTITANIGDPVYISDTATAITYTTISGDAIAASGCVTVTALVEACYLYEWETYKQGCDRGDVFDRVTLGATDYSITEVTVSSVYRDLASSIEELGEAYLTPWSGKLQATATGTGKNSLVIKVLGTDIPIIRMTNPITNYKTYLHGTSSTCVPAGFTELDSCAVAV